MLDKRGAVHRFQIDNYQFSAYIKSDFISHLQQNNILDLAEMHPLLAKGIEDAIKTIKEYFRERTAQDAQSVVDEWKKEKIYPYEGKADNKIEEIERQVFDIVAVKVNDYLPDFPKSHKTNKAFQLRMLKQAIEKSPEELQLIFNEVLDLPQRKQKELAELLKETKLSAIISASKLVADRLKFIAGLETILFDKDIKKHIKERSQLHRILAENTWIFGEEFNLSVDDMSLTEVLRQHKKLLGDKIIIDEPVKDHKQKRGIIDLMLSRSLKHYKADEHEHLIVELKAPKIKLSEKETSQIEKYAFSVSNDERFKDLRGTKWNFWIISDDYNDFVKFKIQDNRDNTIYNQNNIKIFVKTWSTIIEENKARLQFFKEKLEHTVDKGDALTFLKENYKKILSELKIS